MEKRAANSTMLLPDSFMNPDRRDNASFCACRSSNVPRQARKRGGICAHRGLTHLDGPDSGGINKSDIRYLKENLLYLQKQEGFRRKRAGLRFNIMVPKGEGGGQWPLVYFSKLFVCT